MSFSRFLKMATGLSLFLATASYCAAEDTLLSWGALAGERYRLVVSSDIGGNDPDDIQSMVHVLLYSDLFDIEGLICSYPKGTLRALYDVIDAYENDYSRLIEANPKYPTPDYLRRLGKQGAAKPVSETGFREPTEGSQWIIECAKADDPRPLYILVWGAITDVAQAIHDAPEIKPRVRVYSIGSWNTSQDRDARNYIFNEHPDLWLIEAHSTFRGMYVGGNQEGDLENKAFVETHVRDCGALGKHYAEKLGHIKMGDTPSFLYLLAGNPDDPTGEHWGGSFVAPVPGRTYWTDNPDPELAEKGFAGAKTVNRWRESFLRDWQKRMDRIKGR